MNDNGRGDSLVHGVGRRGLLHGRIDETRRSFWAAEGEQIRESDSGDGTKGEGNMGVGRRAFRDASRCSGNLAGIYGAETHSRLLTARLREKQYSVAINAFPIA